MTRPYRSEFDSNLDLRLERVVDVPRELVWKAWTTPEHLVKWFTPAPWSTAECELDLRPGGIFRTVMCSPEGEKFEEVGCYLEVVENERLVWTNALLPGFRPAGPPEDDSAECSRLLMTAIISLEEHGGGTRYTAVAMHGDPSACKQHEAMGFHEGWGKALDQLVEVTRRLG
ncbi:MAG: SRPBCC family protein [Armatimonadota bacterium]